MHVDQHTNTDNDMVTSVLGPLMDGMVCSEACDTLLQLSTGGELTRWWGVCVSSLQLVGGRVLGKLVAHTLVNAWLQMHQERGKKTLLIEYV